MKKTTTPIDWSDLKKILKELGQKYNLIKEPENMVLNSCDYGVPQIRKRVILIGTRKDLSIKPSEIYEGIVKTHCNPENELNSIYFIIHISYFTRYNVHLIITS